VALHYVQEGDNHGATSTRNRTKITLRHCIVARSARFRRCWMLFLTLFLSQAAVERSRFFSASERFASRFLTPDAEWVFYGKARICSVFARSSNVYKTVCLPGCCS